jgi:S1-C subfamily serine protease
MNKLIVSILAAAALGGAAASAAAQTADPEALEQRLADAQRRLEDAAREVAELSGEAAAAGHGEFEIFLPGPRRAMLGVNLGGTEPNGGGVRVEGVSPGGPAAEAGVKSGDVIVAFQSKPVATGRELVKAMEAIEPGQKVALELRRDGKPVKLSVEARPMDRLFMAGPGLIMPGMTAIRALPAMPPMHGVEMVGDTHWLLDEWGDAELVTLTPGLGRYFGADKGVLVAHAPEGSDLGLQDGDVIVAIGGREPQSGRHAMRILRSYQPGESVELRILRDRRAQTLNSKVPARSGHDLLRRRVVPPAPPTPPEAPTDS